MHESKSTLRLILQPLLIAIALALIVRSALHIYAIPSESMTPALEVGDRILVTPYGGLLQEDAPARGEVIVFRSPRNPDELMVKRVIATAGDLVESRAGRVELSGHGLPEPYLVDPSASGSIQPQIVPAGCYFVMGDNRANSYDSRSWGVLPGDLVVGRVRLVLWSSSSSSTETSASAHPVDLHAAPLPTAHAVRFFHPVD